MTLVDERIAHGRDVRPSDILAYDLVQGAHVRWSYIMDKSVPDPPTAVLLHGILGSRKNWGTFARRLAQEFPTWQDRVSKKKIEISRRVGDLCMVENLHLPLSTSPVALSSF
ncbi:uncharacterized protein LOC114322478 isoform X5 [Camellia sinensis]|nr:uncharacterized protein LOC114322478 isoform X5 [Camellia sinensis]